jgi:hypothetical protein
MDHVQVSQKNTRKSTESIKKSRGRKMIHEESAGASPKAGIRTPLLHHETDEADNK